MNLNTKLMGLGLALGMLAIPASAQGTGFYVGGNLSYAGGMSLKNSVTKQDLGLVVDGGYIGKLASTDIPFRASLGLGWFPGAKDNGRQANAFNAQVAGDIFINTPVDKLRLITGLSFNKWRMDISYDDPAMGSFTNNVKGIKFGARLGVDYTFSSKLTGELLLQMTELGTDQDFTKDPQGSTLGRVPINPSWLQVGLKYHF